MGLGLILEDHEEKNCYKKEKKVNHTTKQESKYGWNIISRKLNHVREVW